MRIGLLLLASAGLASCATPLRPTEVTRFHLGAPVARGTIAVEPLAAGSATSLEFQTYAAAVGRELARIGYAPARAGTTAQYLATVGYARASREALQRSPVSIGLGGGGFSGGRRGGGVGLGGGVGFPIGGGPREIIVTELFVTIKRRADLTAVWEGRAQAEADPRKPDADTSAQAGRLAAALFDGFPGESGRTIEVR